MDQITLICREGKVLPHANLMAIYAKHMDGNTLFVQQDRGKCIVYTEDNALLEKLSLMDTVDQIPGRFEVNNRTFRAFLYRNGLQSLKGHLAFYWKVDIKLEHAR